MKSEDVQKFYEEFQPPKGFIVPDGFPICRHKSVFVQRENRSEQMLKSGIVLPETVKTIVPIGRVMAVGPAVTDLKPGMRVIYNFYANSVILHEGVDYMNLSDIDVFAVLPDENDTMMLKSIEKEKRKNFSEEEMPDVEESKEVKQEQQEWAREQAEKIQRTHKKRVHGFKGKGYKK